MPPRFGDGRDWFFEKRFGLFVHWGLYALPAWQEQQQWRASVPRRDYEKLRERFNPTRFDPNAWLDLAEATGMRYLCVTTKHHDGFCLWDTQQTDYNAVKCGPGRDLVREYVEACREFGLRVGFYYSLMDWHHPDGARCATDDAARRRFLDFTQGCVRELCTNYGQLDILWYDVSWPLRTPALWESSKMGAMARAMQPGIIINNRSQLDEDFGTPEEHVTAASAGRDWEACMTFIGSWGYMPSAVDWRPVREVIGMLRTASAGQGNLLLNIGPTPDGSVPPEATERLLPVGKWLEANGEAVYGAVGRTDGRTEWVPTGQWTMKDNTAYYWCNRWPGGELVIGGLTVKVLKASYLATGAPIAFEQSENRLVLKGLPLESPDKFAGVTVIKLELDAPLRQVLGAGCVVL